MSAAQSVLIGSGNGTLFPYWMYVAVFRSLVSDSSATTGQRDKLDRSCGVTTPTGCLDTPLKTQTAMSRADAVRQAGISPLPSRARDSDTDWSCPVLRLGLRRTTRSICWYAGRIFGCLAWLPTKSAESLSCITEIRCVSTWPC